MSKAVDTLARLAANLRPLMNFAEVHAGSTHSIGTLASHLGVSLRTLRFYEQAGLLTPGREGARRVYHAEDRIRLEIIVALREFEVSLPGIKSLLATADAGGPNIEDRILALYDTLLVDVAAVNATRIAELEGINARIELARAALGS